MIKSIKVENDGKKNDSNGSTSSSNFQTYYYLDLTDKSKITITYFSKIDKRTVKPIK